MTTGATERAMQCDAFRRRIPQFLRGRLERRELARFVDHAIACAACEARLLAAPDDRGADGAAE